jgi:hypothetical protein
MIFGNSNSGSKFISTGNSLLFISSKLLSYVISDSPNLRKIKSTREVLKKTIETKKLFFIIF